MAADNDAMAAPDAEERTIEVGAVDRAVPVKSALVTMSQLSAL
jgi:hypothetical protein